MNTPTHIETVIEWFDERGKRLGSVRVPGNPAHVFLDLDGGVVTPVEIAAPEGAAALRAQPVITATEETP